MDIYFDRIKPLLLSTGLTMKKLAPKIGIPVKTIYNWENGVKSYEKYYPQLASYFHVSIEYLKGETDERNPISIRSDLIANRIKSLSPSLQADFLEFLALAPKNPDTAERLLSFAVQELRFATQDR